jgi:hypothetical protein
MSIQSPVGTLDIKNATLRVGKLEVSNVQGIDTALNVTRANSVLIYDDQVSTTTFNGTTSSVGVRDTGNGYLDLAGEYVYWGQKLPNSWVMDFEMDIRSGTNAGPLYANVFSTTNTGGDGYSFVFNDSNDKITLKYDGTTLTETTVSGLFTASEDWQKVVINYERGLIAISVGGARKFYYKDIERETPYVNGEYVSFSSASTDGRKIRDLRIVNGEKWVYSGESNVVYTQGSVGIGVTDPTAALDVSGTVKATAFDGDGSAITNISSASVGDFASNVTRIETLETDLDNNSSRISTISTDLSDNSSRISTISTDLSDNSSRISTVSTDLSDNSSRITALETGDMNISGDKTFQDDVIFESNLRVQGDLLVANTVNMTVSDPILELGSNNLNTGDVGIVMTRHGASNSNVAVFFDETADTLKLGYTLNGANDSTIELDSNHMPVSIQGNVGIRTSSPAYALDVHGNANVNVINVNTIQGLQTMSFSSDSTTVPPLQLTASSLNDGVGALRIDSVEPDIFLNDTDGGFSTVTFANNGESRAAFGRNSGDDFYITVRDPATNGGNWRNTTLVVDSSSGNVSMAYGLTVGSNLEVGTANLFVDTATSNVGIGTDAPTSKLDVHGTANVGALYSTLTYSNASANIAAWNSSTKEIIDSGLERGFTEHPVEPIVFDEITGVYTSVGKLWNASVDGHGTYEITASSFYTASGQQARPPWRLFNYQPSDSSYWQQAGGPVYNTSSPYEYTGTTQFTTDVGGTRYLGHWVQIKVPYAITLAHTDVYRTPESAFTNATSRAPGAGVFLGSNDGEVWYKLTEFSGASYTTDDKERITVNATTPYQYYRFVITNIVGGNSQTVVNFNEWRLFAEKPVTRMENVHISGELSSETLQTGYIKWPKVPLKANESEGYVVSASSVSGNSSYYEAWHAFEDKGEYTSDPHPAWASGTGTFTTGLANTSRTTGEDTFNHEWLQIQLPRTITLSYFLISSRKNRDEYTAPKSGYMYASNDGVTWTKIHTFSGVTSYVDDQNVRFDVSSTTAYSYFRLAVTETDETGTTYKQVFINELQLFEAATGVGAAPTSAKLQVAGSLGMAKGSEFFAGDDVVMELPKHDRPLTKYPEVAMTANSSGGYVASASTTYNNNGAVYPAFAGDDGTTTWLSQDGAFDTTSPYAANSSASTFDGEQCEWIQLQLPKAVKVSYFKIIPRSTAGGTNAAPEDQTKSGSLYGSNDGTNFVKIGDYGDLDYGGASGQLVQTVHMNAKHYYTYLRLTCTARYGNYNNQQWVGIGELELYGYEEGDTSVDVVHRSIPNKPGQQHLEVYWDANDSNSYSFADSSNVYDLSGNGVKGTLTNNVTFDSVHNGWITTSTTASGITGSFSVSGGDWVHSISYWVKVRALPPSSVDYLFGFASAAAYNSIAHYIKPDGTLVTGAWTLDYPTSDFTIPVGEWFHVTTTYQGGGFSPNVNAKTYINGELKHMGTNLSSGTDGTALGIPTSAQVVYFGYGYGGAATSPEATYGSLRMYNKALNADQVRELYEYDAPRFGHRQNLVSLHKGNLGIGVNYPNSRFEVAGADGLQEYPPESMTAYETYIAGHGVFRSSESSKFNNDYPAFNAFNESLNDSVHATSTYNGAASQYNTSTGIYIGSNVTVAGGTTYSGDWVQLEIPNKIKLKSINLASYATSISGRPPKTGVFLGSVNGNDWEVVYTLTGATTWPANAYLSYVVNSSSYYSHFRFVVQEIQATNDGLVAIQGIKYFGTPAPSSLEDGHLTLGKALTLPRVSGHPAGAETPRAESLVVHYDTTVDSVVSGTTVVDTSGSGNNGAISGAVYSSSERALTFDSVNDHMTGTLNNPSGAWVHSVSCWYKPLSVDNGVLWCIGGNAVNKQIGLNNVNGSIRFYIYGCDSTPSPTTTFTTNKWHHVVAVFKNSETTTTNGIVTGRELYIDGVKQTLTATSPQYALNFDANTSFRIANQYNAEYNHGAFSNFKIWGGVALTADEVAAEYALGRTGKALNITDTAVCLGGTAPRAQLDVRGTGMFDGGLVIKADNLEYARDGGITLSRAGLGTAGNQYSSQPIVLDGGDAGAVDANIRGGAIWSQWGSAQYGIAMKGASHNNTYPYLQTPTMFVTNDKVGIGTAVPTAKFTVIGQSGSMSTAARVYWRWNDYIGGSGSAAYLIAGSGNWVNMGIYTTGAIVTSSYFVSHAGVASASDERIKNNIVDADDSECLETLRLLKPKKYGYKDVIERGEEPVWGFIAQEVKETLPYATQLRKDVLPNIYELSNVSSSNVITFTNFNTSNLESNATTLIRTMGIDGEQHDIHLEEVIDEHSIRVKEDLTDWIGSVDETGNVVAGNQLFVYGQEVDDFVFLKKEAIWTVATAALQEVDRQLQAEKAKVADLLARVTALENATGRD